MKKNKIICLLTTLCIACSAVTFCSCGKSQNTKDDDTGKEELYIPGEDDKTPVFEFASQTETVRIGEQLSLSLKNNITNQLVWTVQDPTVAVVKNGLLTAVGLGDTTVTVSGNGYSSTCKVTVVKSANAPVLEVNTDDVTVTKDGQVNLTAKVFWKTEQVNAKVQWNVMNGEETDVVSLTPNADGSSVTLKGLKEGKTTVVAVVEYNSAKTVKPVTVEVVAMDTVIDIQNATYSNRRYSLVGYTANYNLLGYDYSKITDPAVCVYERGEKVDNPTLVWNVEDEEIATVENGKILSKKAGETKITCTYQDVSKEFIFRCVEPEVKFSQKILVETSVNTIVEIQNSDCILGEVRAVEFNGENVGSFVGGQLTVTLKDSQKMGKGTLKIATDTANYSFDTEIYTKVISSKADLDNMGTVAKAQNADTSVWDGYFVLANDIDYNGEFVSFINEENANKKGFIGIFDGQGYNIDGLSVSSRRGGGLFGVMSSTATVKNVSFTNAKVDGSGFICSYGSGYIENVYIEYATVVSSGSTNGYNTGTFFVNGAEQGTKVKKVVVLSDNANYVKGENTTNYKGLYLLGGANSGNVGVYSDVLVSVKNALEGRAVVTVKNGADNYFVSTDRSELSAYVYETFGSWDKEFWTRNDELLPVPCHFNK